MPEKLRKLYERHGDVLRYLIIGGLTTAIDILCFALLHSVLGMGYAIAKVLTVILAVTFAFFGNKWVVFRSKTDSRRETLSEALRFYAFRALTLLFSLGFLYMAIDLLGFDENLSNLICNIVVIVLNYVLSRLFVFKRKEA